MTRALRMFALATALLLAFTACGGGDKVGEQFKDFKGDQGGGRIGEVEQTPTAKPAQSGNKPAQTAAPAQPTQAPAQATSLTVRITREGFDPTAARVTRGSNLKVTNTDAQAHTYTASNGVYDTGSLAPGQSTTFKATTPGDFQMEDRTRNWIIGSLQVIG